jgi:GxxExxY protein
MSRENHETKHHEIHEKDMEDPGSPRQYRLRVPSPLSDETEALVTRAIGCAIRVHKTLGPGFLESIYKKAMAIELKAEGLTFESERAVSVEYRGIKIPGQRIGLIVEKQIVLELKAIKRFDEIHCAQLLSYLRTTGLRIGLLINFRVPLLPHGLRRVVL